MRLLDILKEIEKESSLDNNLQDAKIELQTIQSKSEPYQAQICLITAREGETIKEKSKGLEKHELENCKKSLEEMEKIILLNEWEKYLLDRITDELKTINLKSELQDLKSQNSSTHTPEQQAEIQKKIKEK